MRFCTFVALGLVVLLARSVAADVVVDWNNVLLDTIRTGNVNPPAASRAMAMTHAAIFDAVNTIDRTHFPYRVQLSVSPGASREAAAAQAAHDVLVSLFPARQAVLDTALAGSLGAFPTALRRPEAWRSAGKWRRSTSRCGQVTAAGR